MTARHHCRSLTDQVRVRTTGGKKPIANGVHSPTENGQQTPPSPVAKPAPAPTPAPQPPPAQAPAQAPAPSNVDFPGVDPGQRQSLTTFIRAATSSTLQQVQLPLHPFVGPQHCMHGGGSCLSSYRWCLHAVQVTKNLQQVLENQPGNDKLFISSYLDVLLSKEFEQLDESKKSVRHCFPDCLSCAVFLQSSGTAIESLQCSEVRNSALQSLLQC